MITRDLEQLVRRVAKGFPAITVTGPRQSGKSTLCRSMYPSHTYASLEDPDVRSYAEDDPRGFLSQFKGGAIIDEIQRCPKLPSYLQGLIDNDPQPGRWILTGSHNLSLIESVNQSLAGRTAVLHLLPLTYGEICRFASPPEDLDQVLLSGGYPRIYDMKLSPADWLASYVATYIERDVRAISKIGDLVAFQRFVELCAGRTGQLLNLSSLATDAGITQPTVKAWLSVLEASFITFRLPAYHSNSRKRLVKMPKLHFYDSGLVCWLLGIRTTDQLRNHPLRGAIFETWVIAEIVKHRTNNGEPGSTYFWRDQHGREVDVVIDNGDKLIAAEVKAGQTITSDMLRMITNVANTIRKEQTTETMAVYGGPQTQNRSDLSIMSWKDLHTHKWT